MKAFCSSKNCSPFINWKVTWENTQLDTIKKHTASIHIHKSISVFVLQADSSQVWSSFWALVRKCSSFFSNIFAFPLFLIFYYSIFKNRPNLNILTGFKSLNMSIDLTRYISLHGKYDFQGEKVFNLFKIFLKAKEDILNYRWYKMALKIPWSLHIFRSLCLKLILKCKAEGSGIFSKSHQNIKRIPACDFLLLHMVYKTQNLLM